MSKKFLGLGSNCGNRRFYLEQAILEIEKICQVDEVSPVYETHALLPEGAKGEWDRPFLNLVLQISSDEGGEVFLLRLQKIESQLGRRKAAHWSPRCIDIDILTWGAEECDHSNLKIPHPGLWQRSFVLDPLKDLDISYAPRARQHLQHSPLWMAIFNVSPDSFSNGGRVCSWQKTEKLFQFYSEVGVQIIDLGAESTRPGADPLGVEEEWERLKPYLEVWQNRAVDFKLGPYLSVDTYKPEIARRALTMGAQVINDVSGLSDLGMLEILRDSEVSYVLTHSLGVPADPQKVMAGDPLEDLIHWLESQLELLVKEGISLQRVFFDPGIGFGKTASQSWQIIRKIENLQKFPVRLLVGPSRKSFLQSVISRCFSQRDVETLGVCLELIDKGIDVLRVHNPEFHMRAHRGRSYARI